MSHRDGNGEFPADPCLPVNSQVQGRALQLVHFCLPPSFRPTEVGVVDLRFNPLHPEFASDDGKTRLSYYKDPNSKVDRSEGTITSGATSSPFDVKVDHGTHVAALIASHGKLSQMTGLHPNAVIHAIREDEFDTAIADLKSVHIYSLSLGEPELGIVPPPQWQDLPRKYPATLFVIAAGNDHSEVVEHTLAATGNLNNVIVVAAATTPPNEQQSPVLADFSNRGYASGKEYVSIVAPGEKVKSALFDGGYDVATGTSQSTALVAGAASLLSGIEPHWPPWKIKERLVATTDMRGWIDQRPKDSLGGRRIIDRKISDTKDSVAVLYNNAGVCKGRLTSESLESELMVRREEETHTIRYSNLRRIVRNRDYSGVDQYTFTIMYSRPVDEDDSLSEGRQLIRLRNVQLSELRGATFFQLNAAEEGCRNVNFNIATIEDFINTFY